MNKRKGKKENKQTRYQEKTELHSQSIDYSSPEESFTISKSENRSILTPEDLELRRNKSHNPSEVSGKRNSALLIKRNSLLADRKNIILFKDKNREHRKSIKKKESNDIFGIYGDGNEDEYDSSPKKEHISSDRSERVNNTERKLLDPMCNTLECNNNNTNTNYNKKTSTISLRVPEKSESYVERKKRAFCCFRRKAKIKDATSQDMEIVEEEEPPVGNRWGELNDDEKSTAIKKMWLWAIKETITRNRIRGLLASILGRAIAKKKANENTNKYHKYLVIPGSSQKAAVDMVMLVLLLYMAIITPFIVSFLDGFPLFFSICENVVNALFFVDIIINFDTAFYLHNVLVTDRKTIAIHYLRTWFLIDFISCLPLQEFSKDDGEMPEDNDVLNPRMFRLLTLMKLMKLGRLMKFIQLFIDKLSLKYKFTPESGKALNALISLAFVVHLFGCAWFLFARLANFNPDTWVVRTGYRDAGPFDQYLVAIYWVFQTLTTVGYGDIGAITTNERILSLVLMSFGVGFYSSLFQPMDENEKKLRLNMITLSAFAQKTKLPNEITAKIRNHIEQHSNDFFENMDHKAVFDDLPTNLRAEVIEFTHGKTLKPFRFFAGADPEFIWAMGCKLKSQKLKPGDKLYKIGDHAEEIYFIRNGDIQFLDIEGKMVNTYTQNTYFGEIEALDQAPREHMAIAENNVSLLQIRRKDFLRILNDFPEIYDEVVDMAIRRKGVLAADGLENEKQRLSKKSPLLINTQNSIKSIVGSTPIEPSIHLTTPAVATPKPQRSSLLMARTAYLHHQTTIQNPQKKVSKIMTEFMDIVETDSDLESEMEKEKVQLLPNKKPSDRGILNKLTSMKSFQHLQRFGTGTHLTSNPIMSEALKEIKDMKQSLLNLSKLGNAEMNSFSTPITTPPVKMLSNNTEQGHHIQDAKKGQIMKRTPSAIVLNKLKEFEGEERSGHNWNQVLRSKRNKSLPKNSIFIKQNGTTISPNNNQEIVSVCQQHLGTTTSTNINYLIKTIEIIEKLTDFKFQMDQIIASFQGFGNLYNNIHSSQTQTNTNVQIVLDHVAVISSKLEHMKSTM